MPEETKPQDAAHVAPDNTAEAVTDADAPEATPDAEAAPDNTADAVTGEAVAAATEAPAEDAPAAEESDEDESVLEAVAETVAETAGAVAGTVAGTVEAVADAVAGDDDEAADEAPTEEVTAEAAAESDDDEGLLSKAAKAAGAVAGKVADAVATAAEKVAGAVTGDDEKDGASVLPATGMIGFTGEIVGDVVKLEDLNKAEAEAHDRGYGDYEALVADTLPKVEEKELVTGTVVSLSDKDVVINIGFKSDGVVAKNEFDEAPQQGDEVEVFIQYLEDRQGQLVLSKTKADKVKRWQRIEQAFENEEVLEGTIVRRIKGGMIVELDAGAMEAFLPGSQIDVRPVRDFDVYLERRMEFKVVKLNPANENIVVSHKALIEKDLAAQREKILSTMEPGQVLEGIVKNITDFGVFIDLGGVDGLLHITDLSWGRVSHPSEVVDLDEKMNVVVLDYDKERQRISLGLKQLQPHPWDTLMDRFNTGDTVEGKVVSITDYGAFVELEKGIEGLVHISEMSWTEHVKHPSQMVALGQLVNVKILNIDNESRKISLGMKQLQPDPWESLAERYPAGTVLNGKVRNITNFGVFVEIEPGIDGLVHISDLSWTKRIRHPGEFVKKGQSMDVVILNIDERDRRISLGHKQIETNPWNDFGKVYAEGSETTATITGITDDGITVDLPLDVEGFLPRRELKNDPRVYHTGDTLEGLTVIRFDAGQKDIILSEKAAEVAERLRERAAERAEKATARREERQQVSSYQRQTAASGPTTLGELSGLEALRDQLRAQEEDDLEDDEDLD